jgi:hypothetical protein
MVIALFHFGSLLLVWDMNYLREPRPLFAAREGDGCLNDTDHHMRHLGGHLGDRASTQGIKGVAHGATINLDAGKTPCWAGATPLLQTVPWPKVMLGVAPAHEEIPSDVCPRVSPNSWTKHE